MPVPGHQTLDLPSVGRRIPIRDESGEGGVVHEPQEPDRRIAGGASVGVGTAEEKRRKSTAVV